MSYHLFNIGGKGTDPQWQWMLEEGVITAGFKNQPGDKGEELLRGLPEGDLVVAYANRRGYVGIGRIQPAGTYRLIPETKLPIWKGARHLHYRSVEWLWVVQSLNDAVPISAAEDRFPRHTCESLEAALGDRIKEHLQQKAQERSNAFWWVNHKQTWKAEYEHGYIWSPTANKNGATNQTYLNLKLVRPGDLVFSYAGGVVRGVGVAIGLHTDAEIPDEHWQAEEGWLKAGWSVPIRWFPLAERWSPKSHFSEIRHLLPEKHSPLQHETGNGNQGCYLASVSQQFGAKVLELLRAKNATAVDKVLTEIATAKAAVTAGSLPEAPTPAAGRLPAEQLRKVTPIFIWQAVQNLLQGATVEGFAESTDYDLLADGVRLDPKQVFGLAGTAALGFHLAPSHFTAGKGSLCFELLQAAGFQVVPKEGGLPALDLPIEPEEREWAEGNVKLVYHLKRERSAGLSKAKKEDFKNKHGRLFCEKCGFDPVLVWGEQGEACIEVHHKEIRVAEMKPGHRTKLSQLQCLCANCHRLAHSIVIP